MAKQKKEELKQEEIKMDSEIMNKSPEPKNDDDFANLDKEQDMEEQPKNNDLEEEVEEETEEPVENVETEEGDDEQKAEKTEKSVKKVSAKKEEKVQENIEVSDINESDLFQGLDIQKSVEEKLKELQEENARLRQGQQVQQPQVQQQEQVPDFMKVTEEQLDEIETEDPKRAREIRRAQDRYIAAKDAREEFQRQQYNAMIEKAKNDIKMDANREMVGLLKAKLGIDIKSKIGQDILMEARRLSETDRYKHYKMRPDGQAAMVGYAALHLIDRILEEKSKAKPKVQNAVPRNFTNKISSPTSGGGAEKYSKKVMISL